MSRASFIILSKVFRLFLCMAFGSITLSFAINPEIKISQYGIDVWQAKQGLPYSTITSIAQTPDGYLWLGTPNGLVKFNGVTFTPIEQESLKEGIWNLMVSRDGSLWVCTNGRGLVKVKDDTFTTYTSNDGLSTNRIRATYETKEGVIWVGNHEGGVDIIKDGKITKIQNEIIAKETITTIYQDRAGTIWLGARNGLYKFSNGSFNKYVLFHGNTKVSQILEDRKGTIWIAQGAALTSFKDEQLILYKDQEGKPIYDAYALCEDQDGNLWVGTGSSFFYRLKEGKITAVSRLDDVIHPQINKTKVIFEDKEGVLWIGTEGGGLCNLKDKKYITYATQEGLPKGLVSAVYEDARGRLLVGTRDGIFYLQNNNFINFSVVNPSFKYKQRIMTLHGDKNGDLWAGAITDEVFHLKDSSFETYGINSKDKKQLVLGDKSIVFADQKGNVWVGVNKGSNFINKITRGTVETIELSDNRSKVIIKVIYEDKNSNLWVGTSKGLFQYRDGCLIPYLSNRGDASSITSIIEDQTGTLWVGTLGGLQRYRDGGFTLFSSKEGLHNDIILSLLEDDYGNLWISGDRGYSRISKRDVEEFSLGKLKSIPSLFIEREEGAGISKLIKQYEQPIGQPLAWKTRDGSLWFTSFTGLVMINPTRVRFNNHIPPVHIENILVDRQPISMKENIQIAPGKRDFEFHYVGLSLMEHGKVNYKYKLEGFDKDWVDAGTRRVAYYNQLQPGQYKFRVIASNNDGLWNETGTHVSFYLQPFFYQTKVFYVLCILSVGGLSFAIYRVRVRHLQRSRDAALEASRLKSEFLSTMSHELRTPLNGVIGMSNLLIDTSLDSEQVEFAETIKVSSEALLSVINDILDYTRLEADKISFNNQPFNLRECVEEAAEFLSTGAQAKNLLLDTIIQSDVPPLLYGDRGRIRQLLINMVGNAIKFTHKGHVIVQVSKTEETQTHVGIRCEVIDTGIGIAEEDQKKLFEAFTQVDSSATRKYDGTGLGLAISKQLIQHLGGHIDVKSRKDQGSTFWFTTTFKKQDPAFDTIKTDLNNKQILIISENDSIGENLRHRATSWGMKAIYSNTFQNGLDVLQSEISAGKHFDVLITCVTNQQPNWKDFIVKTSSILKQDDTKIILISPSKKILVDDYLKGINAQIILTPFKSEYLYQCFNESNNQLIMAEPPVPSQNNGNHNHKLEKHVDNSKVKILLAEDNMVNQKVAIKMLNKLGYEPDVVENGKQALSALSQKEYDIILMDCMMPEMDGYEATAEIRKMEGNAKHTKIIAMTANALVGDREKCIEAGMDDYMSKPVQQTELNAVIQKWAESFHK
jgi:signal transduction histidine kinase/ligand-binding sensor domain-containing protein/CheY-like chemotaxis protein